MLTASFPNQVIPRNGRVGAPHACGFRSVARSHASHRRSDCSDAPRTESESAPTMPPAKTGKNARGTSRRAARATNSAPTISASVPWNVTPPERPVAMRSRVKIERGRPRASVPISVAHVSAAAAANAPANAGTNRASRKLASAHNAAMPPFATTCMPSRAPVYRRRRGVPTCASCRRARARPT